MDRLATEGLRAFTGTIEKVTIELKPGTAGARARPERTRAA
jgi:hypothetical protein